LKVTAAAALWYRRRYWGGEVYKMGKIIQYRCGERSGGARVWTHSVTLVTDEVCVAPPSDVYRKVGPAGLELGWACIRLCLSCHLHA
jgi:hypothetical protein